MRVALESDVKIVTPIRGWQARDSLRINSGISVVRPTHWAAVRATYARNRRAADEELKAGRAIPRRRTPGFLSAREVGGVYPPKEDWRPLTNDELECAIGITDGVHLHSTVQILEAPAELIRLARERVSPFLAEPSYEFDPGLMDVGTERLGDLLVHMDQWLANEVLRVSEWVMGSIRVAAPGRVISSGFQGLHIDLYGPVVQAQLNRGYPGSRIVINLTDETRYVAFINLRLATMIARYPGIQTSAHLRDAVSASMGTPQAQGMIANAFMETVPEYPVIRFAVAPGQAYIAPTTVIPHEGLLTAGATHDLILWAGHKGDAHGGEWNPPEYLPGWQARCQGATQSILSSDS